MLIFSDDPATHTRIAAEFSVEQRPGNPHRLLIILSPNNRHPLRRTDFGCDVLSVAEVRAGGYFIRHAGQLAEALAGFVRAHDYAEVAVFGMSKGAAGALNIGRLMAPLGDRVIHVLAFSPQTQLYPPNPDLAFPTYRALLKEAEDDRELRQALEAHGDIPPLDHPRLRACIIYGERNPTDAAEALRVAGPSARFLALPMADHRSVIPFLCDPGDPDAVHAVLYQLMEKSRDEVDVAKLLRPEVMERLELDMAAFPPDRRPPSLPEFIDRFVRTSRTPGP